MRRIDGGVAGVFDIDHPLLMKYAQCVTYLTLIKEFGNVYGRKFLVMASTGNNCEDAVAAVEEYIPLADRLRLL